MTVLLLIAFGPDRWRTPFTWLFGLILMLGYYAPFWIGIPFLPALSAPSTAASVVHVLMAGLSFAALVVLYPLSRRP